MSVKQIFNTSAELDYPTVLPTLDLDFANSKTLDPRITFTRSSGGSYVGADGLIKLAGVNEARFDHDPYTGESLGLLVEESRTNLITYSSTIDTSTSPSNTAWGKGLNTTRIGTTTAPDGTNDAVIYQGIGVGANEFVNQVRSLSASTTFTCTIWAKLISGRIPTSGNIISAAFSTGTIQRSNVPYANNLTTEWKRFSTTFTNVPAGSYNMFFLADANTDAQFAIWGAQLEQGSFPTSYIPTIGSTRTRAADNASITGKNFRDFYRPDEGTVFVRFNIKGFFGTSGFNRVFEFSDETLNNRFSLLLLGTNDDMLESWNINGTQQLNFNTVNTTFNRFYNWVAGYKENDFQRYSIDVNGILDSNTDTSISITTFNRLDIGQDMLPVRKLNGHIARLTYYPKRLPNSQLITLTS